MVTPPASPAQTTQEILEQSHRYLSAASGQVVLMLSSGRGLTRRTINKVLEDLVQAQLTFRRLLDKE